MKVTSPTKVTNLNADKVDGLDASAFTRNTGFLPTEVIDGQGPLPKENIFFTFDRADVVVLANGSGYRDSALVQSAAGPIGMDVYVDGVKRGSAILTTNEQDSHKAFVDDFIVVRNVPAGFHKIELIGKYEVGSCNTATDSSNFCTTTNSGDFFRVTVIPQPIA